MHRYKIVISKSEREELDMWEIRGTVTEASLISYVCTQRLNGTFLALPISLTKVNVIQCSF